MRVTPAAVLFLGSVLIGGCAEGPTIGETPGARAEPAAGGSRIVVYRTQMVLGAAVQPVVNVDGRTTGECKPNGVFFVDVPPGRHSVAARTEAESSVTVEMAAGSTVYIKCEIGIGLFIGQPHLRVVPAEVAAGEVGPLSYTGTF